MKRKLAKLQKKAEEVSVSSGDDGEEDQVMTLLTKRDEEILEERRALEHEKKSLVPYRNKQRVLLLSSRGITTRYRHFMEDMRALIPHHIKEVKHDDKKRLFEINGLSELKGCNGCLFFEVRKKKDLYLWMTQPPNGPSVRFLVSNVHTMDELQMTGNCLLGSRPILSFSNEFDTIPNLQLSKQMLTKIFNTPRGHPQSKPFVDRLAQFTYLDGRIWVRMYQIVDLTKDQREIRKMDKQGEETFTLNEIGPRFVLTVVKIFQGSFGGRTLFENPDYVSPNDHRALLKRSLGEKYSNRQKSMRRTESRRQEIEQAVPEDKLANKKVFFSS